MLIKSRKNLASALLFFFINSRKCGVKKEGKSIFQCPQQIMYRRERVLFIITNIIKKTGY